MYLLGALPMTWFGCGPFARMVVAGVIYELRLVITRALAIADREDNKKYVELVCDTYRHWPVRVILWALVMVTFLLPFIYMAEVAVAQVIAHVIHNLEVVMALTTALNSAQIKYRNAPLETPRRVALDLLFDLRTGAQDPAQVVLDVESHGDRAPWHAP